MAQLWKSFMDALAPQQQTERPRREGVTLNRTVGERPLSHCEPSNQAEGQSSRALEYREVMRADLNIPLAKETSARGVRLTRTVMSSFSIRGRLCQPNPW